MPHSARRSSNSRLAPTWAASRANSLRTVPPGWIRTNSCMLFPDECKAFDFTGNRKALDCLREHQTLALPVQLPDAAVLNLVQRETASSGAAWLDTQLFQQRFQVGFVDGYLPALLALRRNLDGAFIACLKETHLGHGILFAAGKRAAVLLCPGFQGRLVNEDLESECGLAVDGNRVGKLAARAAVALRAIPFEEGVLLTVAVGGRVGLDAADGIGARHARIICWQSADVNAGVGSGADSELALRSGERVPDWDSGRRCTQPATGRNGSENSRQNGVTRKFTKDCSD